jgi:hypothetical protein
VFAVCKVLSTAAALCLLCLTHLLYGVQSMFRPLQEHLRCTLIALQQGHAHVLQVMGVHCMLAAQLHNHMCS